MNIIATTAAQLMTSTNTHVTTHCTHSLIGMLRSARAVRGTVCAHSSRVKTTAAAVLVAGAGSRRLLDGNDDVIVFSDDNSSHNGNVVWQWVPFVWCGVWFS